MSKKKALKYTTATFIEKARTVHGNRYNYSLADYVGATNKLIIVCKKHGNFLQTPSNHISNRCGCPKCGDESAHSTTTLSTEQFIEKSKVYHDDRYDYSHTNYINSNTNVTIVCKKHGEFQQCPSIHMTGAGCKKCADKALAHTTEDFVKNATAVHGTRYNYSNSVYKTSNLKVEIICNIHGSFLQSPDTHVNGRYGCKKCSNEALALTTEQFIQKAQVVHGDLYDYSLVVYKHCNTRVQIVCNEHGEFLQKPSSHLHSKNGCPQCKPGTVSKKETKWLNFQGIPNNVTYRQVKVKVGDGLICVDGFDSKTNTVYEFWGDFWHGHPTKYDPTTINKVTNTTFVELYEKTMNRRQSILSAGYNLVEIWESDWDQ